MLIFKSALTLISLGVICGVHIATRITPQLTSKILAIVNICLHIAFLFVLMIEKIPIAESVLCYMISLFVYTLTFFIVHTISLREGSVKEDAYDL